MLWMVKTVGRFFDGGIIGVRRTQKHRDHGCLPVVAMQNVRHPELLRELNAPRGRTPYNAPRCRDIRDSCRRKSRRGQNKMDRRENSSAPLDENHRWKLPGNATECPCGIVRLGTTVLLAFTPRYRGRNTATSWPSLTNARGNASITSARPPVLA